MQKFHCIFICKYEQFGYQLWLQLWVPLLFEQVKKTTALVGKKKKSKFTLHFYTLQVSNSKRYPTFLHNIFCKNSQKSKISFNFIVVSLLCDLQCIVTIAFYMQASF